MSEGTSMYTKASLAATQWFSAQRRMKIDL